MRREHVEGELHAGCVEILAMMSRLDVAKSQATLTSNRASTSDLVVMEELGWISSFGVRNERKYRITDAGLAVVRELAEFLKQKGVAS